MLPLPDLEHLSHAELKSLVVKQWEETAELRRMVTALRDEISRLKGGPGRPNIKPSGMERATEPKPAGSSGNKRGPRGGTRSKLSIHAEQTIIKVARMWMMTALRLDTHFGVASDPAEFARQLRAKLD